MKDNRQKFEKSIDAALRMDISGDSYEKNTIQGLDKRISQLELRVIAAEERIKQLESREEYDVMYNSGEIVIKDNNDSLCGMLTKVLKENAAYIGTEEDNDKRYQQWLKYNFFPPELNIDEVSKEMINQSFNSDVIKPQPNIHPEDWASGLID